MSKLAVLAQRVSGHRWFPLALALLAIVLMLPALAAGLFGDDLIQRLTQLRPEQLPPRVTETGFVSSDSGQLRTVLRDLFAYLGQEGAAARAREYGIAPWWAPEAWKAGLWRPVTAFTHWLDYRLFPNTPPLMHAHNIAWFAFAVFLVATAYRRIATLSQVTDGAVLSLSPSDGERLGVRGVVAGLAACLWLLAKDTYGPVAYVANRGFFIALVFGLLCLLSHHRWRTTQSSIWMWLSALCLLLSLLANEGGASTLAFLVAYALVLEPALRCRSRREEALTNFGFRISDLRFFLLTLLPAAVVVLLWRAVYAGSGFGVRNVIGYIDPGYEPLLFLKKLLPRMNGLLGGQLTGLPPEIDFGLSPQCQTILALFYAGFSVICLLVFLPISRRDVVARFWAAVMLLALVPAATVVPLSKNLAFVAVGAFGLIASFLVHFATSRGDLPLPFRRGEGRGEGSVFAQRFMEKAFRTTAWCVAGWLLLAHIPGALAARAVLAYASPHIPEAWRYCLSFDGLPDAGGRDLVVVSDPTLIPAVAVFDRAYRGQPLPRSVRTLAPGMTDLEVHRPDASTLVLTAKGDDLFECPALGPIHIGYATKNMCDFLFRSGTWKAGDRFTRKGLVAEVLEVSARGAPRSVAFHFDRALESENMVWLFFDWRQGTHCTFALPQIGYTVDIAGPHSRLAASH